MLREVVSNEWFTVIFMVCLLILVLAKQLFPARFLDFLLTPSSSKYLKVYVKERKSIDLFDVLLYSNFALMLSIFAFLLYKHSITKTTFEIVLFLKIALVIASAFLIKLLLEKLVSRLFDIQNIIDNYLFQKTSYKNYIGLILLPINVLLIYSLNPTKNVFIVIISILLLINLIGFITSLRTYQKLIISHLFYFILYLCAFEIAPYVILYKVFIDF